jgi:hypothetical protein
VAVSRLLAAVGVFGFLAGLGLGAMSLFGD